MKTNKLFCLLLGLCLLISLRAQEVCKDTDGCVCSDEGFCECDG